jgi:hypothetical protein
MTAQLTSISTTFTVEDLLTGSSATGAGSAIRRPRSSRGVGRFVSTMLHPVPGMRGALAGVLTAALTAGIWAGLTWGVIPASKQITVQTPIGAQTHTVAIAPWPSSVAIGFGLLALLSAVAGVRLARDLGRREAAQG